MAVVSLLQIYMFMDTILNLLSFVGSLALFLFGMKTMSEGLEKIAGSKMRGIISVMTRNRFLGVLTGMGVTATIQSSSATTVMVVSFVNAGLMTLTQAISVIMGANIGTTVTAWIVSFVGFKINISALSLPLLALAMPLMFSKIEKRKNWGEFIFGFAFLFMGLKMLSGAAESLNIDKHIGAWLTYMPVDSWGAIPTFALIGALLTMAMQSSSASMAITLMLLDMDIPGFGFGQAAALVLGQEIGTTVTALLAALTANTQARRAALAHMSFNVFGVLLILSIFRPFTAGVQWIVDNVMGGAVNNMYLLSAFHTCFNLFNTLILIWFVPQIEKFVCWIMPGNAGDEKGLQYISGGMLSTSELSILQAQKEVLNFAEYVGKMLLRVKELVSSSKDEAFAAGYARILKYEKETDSMEIEIAEYLHKVAEGRLSAESKVQITRMLRQIDELESIGDSCERLGRTLQSCRNNCPEWFTDLLQVRMEEMIDIARVAVRQMCDVLVGVEGGLGSSGVGSGMRELIARSHATEDRINNMRDEYKAWNLQDIESGMYSYQLGVFYTDFIAECEKVGDFVINVVETVE